MIQNDKKFDKMQAVEYLISEIKQDVMAHEKEESECKKYYAMPPETRKGMQRPRTITGLKSHIQDNIKLVRRYLLEISKNVE